MEELVLDTNTFFQNVASQNGFAICIQNSLNWVKLQNNIFSYNSVANKKQNEGSVVYLENPGNTTKALQKTEFFSVFFVKANKPLF